MNNEYKLLSSTILRCALSKDCLDRIKYAQLFLKHLKICEQNTNKTKQIMEDMIDKLTNATQIIQKQNEWIDCLYAAAGKDKNKIIETANIARNVLENYKKKKERI